jgi:hypothetical protein
MSDTTRLFAMGVMQNNQSGSALFTATHLFDGTVPGISDLLVKYTYVGDANLSGSVDGSDYSLIDAGYLAHATNWYNGDFNYDGVINGSDYTLIDNAYNTQGAAAAFQLAAVQAIPTAQIAGTAAVPEPASASLAGMAMFALLSRRPTRSKRTDGPVQKLH